MPTFPENEVELVPRFLLDFDPSWLEIRASVARVGFSGQLPIASEGERVLGDPELLRETVDARRNLHAVLQRAEILSQQAKLIWDFLRLPPADARPTIEALVPTATGNGGIDFSVALRTTPVTVTLVIPPDEEFGRPTRQQFVARGYGGRQPDAAGQNRINRWAHFVASTDSQRFCFSLMGMEANTALSKWEDSIRLGSALLETQRAGSAQRRCVALRLAFAHSALADRRFRAKRVLGAAERQAVLAEYNSATQLMVREGVAADNPRRQELEAHAALQRSKLENGLNYLGMYEAFVPVQEFSRLNQLSEAQVNAAIKAAQDFSASANRFDQAFDEAARAELGKKEETLNGKILLEQRANATLGVERIETEIAAIDRQREKLGDIMSSVPTVGSAVLQAAVTGMNVGGQASTLLGLAQAGLGISGVLTNSSAQSEQLEQQRKVAALEKRMAENNGDINRLEIEASRARLAFLDQKSARLEHGRASPDLLMLLAEINRKRALRELDAAILASYLAERAVAFFLGQPAMRHIQFDYLDRLGGLEEAANALDVDRRATLAEFGATAQESIDDFVEKVSLRETYPVQFQRLLQTGEMEFTYSLYQLSQVRPGSHQCRLHGVAVQIVGLLPITGFSGNLIQSGRFLVRDRAATLNPETTRLVPTTEQLERALTEQSEKGLAVASVGGVLYYDMDLESKELSESSSLVPPPSGGFTRKLFEGRAPTGQWKLIVRRHTELSIADVIIHFGIVSRESDPVALEPKVQELLRSYEAELAQGDIQDRVSVFSLKESFGDAHAALRRGTAEFVLADENFHVGITDLQFKTVLVQAVDHNERAVPGIEVEISRQSSEFHRSGVTRSDGFSEDLSADLPSLPRDQRFPVTGVWQVRLPEPAQFARFADLRLFFIYTFNVRRAG